MENSDTPKRITFSYFATNLIQQIANHCTPKSNAQRKAAGKQRDKSHPALDIFEVFLQDLREKHRPLPLGTTSIVLRFLFPEEDHKRKFGLSSEGLSDVIVEVLGIDPARMRGEAKNYSGCLGGEVLKALSETYSGSNDPDDGLDIFEVDELLNQLASTSPWTHSSFSKQTQKRRGNSDKERQTRKGILRTLYRQMSPWEAAVLTQLILKDMNALLYPQLERDTTAALKEYNTKAVKMLTKEQAMRVWDVKNRLNRSYIARWDIDAAAKAYESNQEAGPEIGFQIGVPKSQKGHSCKHALSFFPKHTQVWAETKYDGERAQIHVQILPWGEPKITIFSKSKRESTNDRLALHPIILDCLGLGEKTGTKPRIRRNVILDAEMLAFQGTQILEFWRIRRLIGETASGVRGFARWQQSRHDQDDNVSVSSLKSSAEDQHLGLVFFDVMYLDDESLVREPYTRRREILEELIVTEPGYAMLAERSLLDLDEHSYGTSSDHELGAMDVDYDSDLDEEGGAARRALHLILAKRMAACEEGLVLKAADSEYNQYQNPWVKLKKDYIPGLGDMVDLVILGAAYEQERAQELRVPPTTMTTFYIGAQTNKAETQNDPAAQPHFYIYFTAAYGLSRAQLEELNFLIKTNDPLPCGKKSMPVDELSYTYDFYAKLARPSFFLRDPIAVELYGDRFTVSAGSKQYELRWPRITKYFRSRERTWVDCMSLQELHVQAREAMGRVSATDAALVQARDIFGFQHEVGGDSGGNTDNGTRIMATKARVEEWRLTIAEADKPKRKRAGGVKRAGNSSRETLGKGSSTLMKRKSRSFVHEDDFPWNKKQRKAAYDTTIPRTLSGWAPPRRSIPASASLVPASHTIPTAVEVSQKSMLMHADDRALRKPPLIIGEEDTDIEEEEVAPLRTTTNQDLSAPDDSAQPLPFSGSQSSNPNDENAKPGPSCNALTKQRSHLSLKVQYPSPPTSPVKMEGVLESSAQAASTSSPPQNHVYVPEFFHRALYWVPSMKYPENARRVTSLVESGERAWAIETFLLCCGWNPRGDSRFGQFPYRFMPTRGIVFLDLDDEFGPEWQKVMVAAVEKMRREEKRARVAAEQAKARSRLRSESRLKSKSKSGRRVRGRHGVDANVVQLPRVPVPIWVFNRRTFKWAEDEKEKENEERVDYRDQAIYVFEPEV